MQRNWLEVTYLMGNLSPLVWDKKDPHTWKTECGGYQIIFIREKKMYSLTWFLAGTDPCKFMFEKLGEALAEADDLNQL